MDMSNKPEGATHYREDWHCTSTGGIQYYKLDRVGWSYWGESLTKGWTECDHPVCGYKEIPVPTQPIPCAPETPTLETMLTEWRDLTARAQAAQAEADALFEHAAQCHGEICVRLAELGWGAPRVATVVSDGVDWSKAQPDDTGAMVAQFDHEDGDFAKGYVEFVPSDDECKNFHQADDGWKWVPRPGVTPSAQQ